jgi:hypothetical protein
MGADDDEVNALGEQGVQYVWVNLDLQGASRRIASS